ncbi:dimethylarginine dimethylaminohydrolase [Alphaproteobacteria bacterium 46_93_T64]|nr:dimethylarginine dimethylaminohydrolase [Alphaproteobacteria bacterium 46_93_T64]
MSSSATRFSHAITRLPAKSIVDGLRACNTGNPSHELFQEHHAAYVSVLKETGAEVTELPALENYSDSVFVEDTALCLKEGVIIMRPGAPSRAGEAAAITSTLKTLFSDVRVIENGHIEGGDILVTASEILVGKSERTDAEGIAALRVCVADWGYKVRELQTPADVLHFKTDCGLLDENTILSTRRLADSGCFEGYRVLYTAEDEEASANAVCFNDVILFPAGFPKTAAMLEAEGYRIVQIPNTEAAKVDGGMSCLSLRLTPNI